jgi:hypothetical protein
LPARPARRRLSPIEVEGRFNAELQPVKLKSGRIGLVIDVVAGRSGRGFRPATARRRGQGRQARPVLMFVLTRGPLHGRRADRPGSLRQPLGKPNRRQHRNKAGTRDMTKQMQVLLAVKALVSAAFPLATIAGFDQDDAKPTRIDANGCIIGHPGEPGDPEVDLSPLTYNYSHLIPLEVVGPDGAGGAELDAMLATLADAVAADPTLGGLCDYFSITAPDFNDRSTEALASTNWATVPLMAEYSTDNALR